ncbi:MAG: hypothetical protein AB8B79_15760 [Granulosicoccus sp.]
MNVRWCVALTFVLGVSVVAASTYIWLSRTTLLARDGVRQVRIEEQLLQRQLVQLENHENTVLIPGLEQSMQELQVQLVEELSQGDMEPDISSVEFEQSVLTALIPGETTGDVKTLRLIVSLSARHSAALLKFLRRIRQSVPTWPSEVRACRIERIPASLISIQCVIDFYHWSRLGVQQ